MATKQKLSTPYDDLLKVRGKLQHLTLEWTPVSWLSLADPLLNRVLGREDRGIPYGRIIELSGLESAGKTALALHLSGLVQKDGGTAYWADFETSFDPEWATACGINVDATYIFQPFVGQFGRVKELRLCSAQELCSEIEAVLNLNYERHPKGRSILVVDSLASMLPELEAAQGLEGRNLRTSMALPVFLGSLLRRWVGLAQAHSLIIVLINQLRENPMQMFGDPYYSPGGNAPRFYSHIRARVRRAKGGRILQKGKQIGIQGIITNLKNKSGGQEKEAAAYRFYFGGKVEFVEASVLEAPEK